MGIFTSENDSKVIHYHGTPITPKAELQKMSGRNFCVSYYRPDNLKTCLEIGQSVMLDNGAFSAYTKGVKINIKDYYRWLEPILVHPHWAVVPDAIGGTVEDQHKLLVTWPRETISMDFAAPVFHLHLPLKHLWFLCNAYPKVCLGSSGEYWNVGSPSWCGRMDEIFNYLSKRNWMPWLHGMRMLSQMSGGWPLASADSTNVAQNFKPGCAECMAQKIDGTNPSPKWTSREIQERLFV